MTAKERLLRLAQRKARIDALQDRLIWLRQKAAMAGTRYSTAPGGGTRRESGQEQFIADIMEAEERLRAQISAQIAEEQAAEVAIELLEDPNERDVLKMRFLNGWLVVKVAQKMNYAERQVLRLQERGLQHLEEHWREM